MKKIILAIILILSIAFVLVLPQLSSKENTVFNVGKINDFSIGTSKLLPYAKALIITDSQGIYAISAVCTHRGCLIKEKSGILVCPCHNSQFAFDGKVLKGPARENLIWRSLTTDKMGNLTLDTSKKVPAGTKVSLTMTK